MAVTEARFRAVERDVSKLLQKDAANSEVLRQLSLQMTELDATTKTLNQTIEQSKGAVWVLAAGGAVIGGLMHFIVDVWRKNS